MKHPNLGVHKTGSSSLKELEGVAGVGLVTLAATLSSIGTVPFAGLVLLRGMDRSMNEAAVVNLLGNGGATIAISRWDNAPDLDRVDQVITSRWRDAIPNQRRRAFHGRRKNCSD